MAKTDVVIGIRLYWNDADGDTVCAGCANVVVKMKDGHSDEDAVRAACERVLRVLDKDGIQCEVEYV